MNLTETQIIVNNLIKERKINNNIFDNSNSSNNNQQNNKMYNSNPTNNFNNNIQMNFNINKNDNKMNNNFNQNNFCNLMMFNMMQMLTMNKMMGINNMIINQMINNQNFINQNNLKNNSNNNNNQNLTKDDNKIVINDLLIPDSKDIQKYFPLIGLNNVGLTCYMNSTLQCLLHLPELNYYFINNYPKQKKNFCKINNDAETEGIISKYYYDVVNGVCKNLSNQKLYFKNSFSPKEFNNLRLMIQKIYYYIYSNQCMQN